MTNINHDLNKLPQRGFLYDTINKIIDNIREILIKIDILNGDIDLTELKDKINVNTNEISDIKQDIGILKRDIKVDITRLIHVDTTIAKQVNTLESSTTTNANDIASLQDSKTSFTNSISTLNTFKTNTTSTLTSNGITANSNHNARIASLETSLANALERIAALEAKESRSFSAAFNESYG